MVGLNNWFMDYLDWLIDWLISSLIYCLIDWLIDWGIDDQNNVSVLAQKWCSHMLDLWQSLMIPTSSLIWALFLQSKMAAMSRRTATVWNGLIGLFIANCWFLTDSDMSKHKELTLCDLFQENQLCSVNRRRRWPDFTPKCWNTTTPPRTCSTKTFSKTGGRSASVFDNQWSRGRSSHWEIMLRIA